MQVNVQLLGCIVTRMLHFQSVPSLLHVTLKKVKEWYRTPDYKLKCNTIVPCNDHCKCCLIKISRIHIHLKISRNARCNKIQIYEIIPTQRVNFFKSSIFLSAWILYTSCKKNGTRVLNNFQVKKVRNAL